MSDDPSKIEIVRCPRQKSECVAQLQLINQCFDISQQLRLNKDYLHSIEVLEKAFECTWEMRENSCQGCATLFRQLIIATLETIRNELHQMTSGWFGAHDYQSCLDQATQSLQACRLRM